MEDRINMTADEFASQWAHWVPGSISREEADLLQDMLVNILTEFEKRGSVTHRTQLFGPNMTVVYTSPDSRKEPN